MTELEAKAAEAWLAMIEPPPLALVNDLLEPQDPMPPALALDMVQDVTGGRDDAVTALLEAASRWLALERVGAVLRSISGEVHDGNSTDAALVSDYIRSECLGLAAVHLSHIRERNTYPLATRAEQRAITWWRTWEEKATRALALCREICAAAHPVEGAP